MKTCGPKEESGYTHAYNEEPITFVPGNPHKNDRPVSFSLQRIVQDLQDSPYIVEMKMFPK